MMYEGKEEKRMNNGDAGEERERRGGGGASGLKVGEMSKMWLKRTV